MAITGPSVVPLQRRFEAIASDMKRALLFNLAEEARTQVVKGFEAERDPYGAPWPARKSRPRRGRQGGKLLQDTRRLMNSINPRPAGDSIRFDTNVAYAKVHNYGGKHTPKRQFLPDVGNGFGPIWTAAFQRVAEKLMERAVRR